MRINFTEVADVLRVPALTVFRLFDMAVGYLSCDKDVLDANRFPFQQILYKNRHVLLEEYKKLISGNEIYDGNKFYKTAGEKKINAGGDLKVFPILLFNYILSENAAKCPETFRIASELPGCCTISYSILGPGKHALPHRGVYRGVYRCLFVLSMADEGDCWLRVNDRKIFFREGESILFDDTATHEVKNETSEPRVALFLDLYRKLPFPLNLINDMFYFLLRKSYVLGITNAYNELETITLRNFVPTPALLK